MAAFIPLLLTSTSKTQPRHYHPTLPLPEPQGSLPSYRPPTDTALASLGILRDLLLLQFSGQNPFPNCTSSECPKGFPLLLQPWHLLIFICSAWSLLARARARTHTHTHTHTHTKQYIGQTTQHKESHTNIGFGCGFFFFFVFCFLDVWCIGKRNGDGFNPYTREMSWVRGTQISGISDKILLLPTPRL